VGCLLLIWVNEEKAKGKTRNTEVTFKTEAIAALAQNVLLSIDLLKGTRAGCAD
jgi:hypothetical protein